ncbi:hypothetical protein DL766_002250 [Monosporascus sp. MC13-8B]|uniref:2EXR domain-containing protein n=1 Tax=Monosporascus cannonballus TaxID=155416 RepID=A0ABY0HJ22_9PEZI|nr:hypothetical protein DL763_004126 [Monosporascus cannonballus]RYO94595.1 hypothetical protein DL762_000487 [Monosporascus cannonballus]RYP35980.1 hypothetical protein DL766_002250 [Monosporascus sp. MC13-8B]
MRSIFTGTTDGPRSVLLTSQEAGDDSNSASSISPEATNSIASVLSTSTETTGVPDSVPISAKTTTERGSGHETVESNAPRNFTRFGRLPVDVRLMIWRLALPARRFVSLDDWPLYPTYPLNYASVLPPAMFHACAEPRRMLLERGIMFVYSEIVSAHVRRLTETSYNKIGRLLPEKVHRVEWYDRINDIFWIRSIRAFASRRLLPGSLVGGTVLANVLELVEDTYRGVEASDCFRKTFLEGHFAGVKTLLLSLLTVECTTDLGIYTENNRAVINLDDKRLPILLRPAFDQLRSMTALGGAKALTHKRPARLLHHLHDEWERKGGLKCLFEEQWIHNTLKYNMETIKDSDEPTEIDTSLLPQGRWGYKNRLRMVDREKELVQSAVKSMPEIEPVIIFLKTAFLKCEDADPALRERGCFRQWVRGRRYDGLEAISNRRGLALSKVPHRWSPDLSL